jgi:putative transcriptional regulator
MRPTHPSVSDMQGYLGGQLLVATPLVTSPGLSHSVIFLCAHDAQGAMGIIVNHIIDNISYKELFEQLSIEQNDSVPSMPVYYGGPVEINRGFVLYHFDELPHPETILTVGDIAVSSSIHVLRDIGMGRGPKQSMLALGYAGWAAGQLEAEIEELIFATDNDLKWKRAGGALGIDISRLTSDVGHA